MTLVEVIPASAMARTKPKSASLTSPSSEISTFSGLMSRCTSPARWATPIRRAPGAAPPPPRAVASGRVPEAVPQGSALDEFHHQEWAGGIVPLVVDGDQSGVPQPGDGLSLALESGEELLIAGVARIHHFQRDWAVEPSIEAAVHRGHAAGGNRGLDAVPAVEQHADEGVRRHRSILGRSRCPPGGPVRRRWRRVPPSVPTLRVLRSP